MKKETPLCAVYLYDPSGLITDVDSGEPISNAIRILQTQGLCAIMLPTAYEVC